MDIQWLLTFDAIVKAGTFAKAAEKLGYTQSTVTFQIRQLELELGVPLFEKIGRKMQLTDAGRAVVPMARETIESTERLKNLGKEPKALVGRLTISVSDGIFRFTSLYDSISVFLKKAPNVDLTVTRRACSDSVDAVKTGVADVGIIFQVEGLEDPALSITNLHWVTPVLVASGVVDTDWDLSSLPTDGRKPFFITDPRCAFHGVYKRYMKQRGISENSETVLGDWGSTLYGIEHGVGISLVPKEQVTRELESGAIRIIPTEGLRERVYIAMAIHKNKHRSPAIHLFSELVEERLQKQAYSDSPPAK